MIQGEIRHRFSSGGGENGGRLSLVGGRANGRGAQRTIKVLVADDDRDTVLSLRMLLETEDYEVMGVYDAHSVLQGVRAFEPDAVLLDIGMPQMTGYDIARELRRTRGNDLMLIAVTAWSKFSDKMAAHIAGFDHHVSKPYQPDEILALLQPLADHIGRL
jgi:DNA-binding response OmpR family regulator